MQSTGRTGVVPFYNGYDFGEHWQLLGDSHTSPCPEGDEPKTEELPDGTVILSSRTTGRFFNFFRYDDQIVSTAVHVQRTLLVGK